MQRIVITGCSGSGKSTLARELGSRLGLPVVHLDALYWQPGWKAHPDREAFQAQIHEIEKGERWIIDGGYLTGHAARRYERADTAILMDFPLWLCLWGVLWRVVEFRWKSRPDMAPGCPERIDPEFLAYVWNYQRKILPKREQEIARYFKGKPIRLHSRREVEAFLETLPKPANLVA
jgi:adenylate kinase family enzyme